MPYTFSIVFGGLCALVPRVDKDPTKNQLDILLVNTQNARADQLNHQPPLHVPRLEFNLSDLAGGGGPAATQGYWRLNFEELAISAKSSDPPIDFGDLSKVQSGDTKGDTALSWIPSLQSICPEAGPVEADCYAPQPSMDRRQGFILGRLIMNKGVANVRQVADYRGSEVMAEFVPKPTGSTAARAAMPHLAQVSINVDDGEVVTITGTRFNGTGSRSLRLGPPTPPLREIEVHLTNLCCGGYQDGDPNQLPKEDADFECFYILCDNFAQLRADLPQLPIPVPVDYVAKPTIDSGTSGGAHPIECSMTRMAG